MPRVNIFCFNLAHFPDFFREMGPFLLSPGERERRDRFSLPHLGNRFAAAHIGLRLLLAQQLQPKAYWQDSILLKTAASLAFDKGPFGKPKLKGPLPLAFNLSHSGDWAALAIVDKDDPTKEPLEVGLDLETVAQRSALALAKRFFSPEEWQSLSLCPDYAQQNRLFTKLWTRKEACLKLWGTGMSTSLSSFEVLSKLPQNLTAQPLPLPQCLYLRTTEVFKDMYLSLALNFLPDSVNINLINWTNHPTTFTFCH